MFEWLNIMFSIVIGNEKIPAHCGITIFVNQF